MGNEIEYKNEKQGLKIENNVSDNEISDFKKEIEIETSSSSSRNSSSDSSKSQKNKLKQEDDFNIESDMLLEISKSNKTESEINYDKIQTHTIITDCIDIDNSGNEKIVHKLHEEVGVRDKPDDKFVIKSIVHITDDNENTIEKEIFMDDKKNVVD